MGGSERSEEGGKAWARSAPIFRRAPGRAPPGATHTEGGAQDPGAGKRTNRMTWRGVAMSPAFDWNAFANAIARLAMVAMEWYRLIEGGGALGEQANHLAVQRRLARVLDPDRPERTIEEAEIEEAREAEERLANSEA